VSKTHSIKYDDECNKFKSNISKYGNTNWSIPVNRNNLLKVCHQNIRGLLGKTEELLSCLLFDPPNIICLTEHRLKDFEVNSILIDNYELGAKYCRKFYKNGGVCIFVHDSIKFSNVSVEENCVEKDIEACAIKLISTNIMITVLTVYRSPSGNFGKFLHKLDNILNTVHNNKSEFITCGDVNINYLQNCDRRQQLDALLSTYNLKGTVNFPTRIVNGSSTAIDNVYIRRSRNYIINPVVNWLSDHDAQMILISDIMLPRQVCSPQYIRNYSSYNTSKFQELLSYEQWDDVLICDDANTTFNVFPNTYLKIFYHNQY
jgi:hypothetical protein